MTKKRKNQLSFFSQSADFVIKNKQTADQKTKNGMNRTDMQKVSKILPKSAIVCCEETYAQNYSLQIFLNLF